MTEPRNDGDCANCGSQCVNKLFDNDLLTELGQGIRSIQYKKGETILKQSTFTNDVLFIKTGIAKLVLESSSKKETIFQIVPSGSFVSLSVLFASNYVPFTVVALKDCTVCHIRKDIFKRLLPESRKANDFLLSSYNEESQYFINKILILSTRNNHGKLAEALLYTSGSDMKNEDVTKCLSRNEWADLAAISLESANKILSELKNDLIIKITDNGIVICNTELLERLRRIG